MHWLSFIAYGCRAAIGVTCVVKIIYNKKNCIPLSWGDRTRNAANKCDMHWPSFIAYGCRAAIGVTCVVKIIHNKKNAYRYRAAIEPTILQTSVTCIGQRLLHTAVVQRSNPQYCTLV